MLLPRRIIWVNGLPRSGTSWLCQIIDSSPQVAFRMAPLFSWQFRDRMRIDDDDIAWSLFFKEVYRTNDAWMLQTERRKSGLFPSFASKQVHPGVLVVKDVRHHDYIPRLLQLPIDFHVVHIIRDPRAAICSWLTDPKQFPATADTLVHWRSGAVRKISPHEFWGFEDWKKLTAYYLRAKEEHPDRVHLVRFEELAADPLRWGRALYEELGLEWSDQTEAFIQNSTSAHASDPSSVFKDRSVMWRWKTDLPTTIAEQIEADLAGTLLARYIGP